MRCITTALALLLLSGSPAVAQIQNGTVTGVVKDQQGGVLPGVTATLQGVDATRTFVTEAAGEFRFLELAPGPYKLSVSLSGFQTIVRDNLIVEVGKNVSLALALKVAPVAETITVVGATPIIDARYSAEPCRSLLMPSTGIFTAFAAAAVKLFARASSIALARNAWLLAPVTATRTPAAVCATNTPISAKREAGCLYLTYAAFCAAGKLTEVISSPGCRSNFL